MADDVDLAGTETTRCCVVGAGRAGVVLALLLASAELPVTLLEALHDCL
jgi:2-polyprenyl-6-methoxyphenol hydroxylase-like FAD-dependent oxidoreductase